jgi:hypothetical protein
LRGTSRWRMSATGGNWRAPGRGCTISALNLHLVCARGLGLRSENAPDHHCWLALRSPTGENFLNQRTQPADSTQDGHDLGVHPISGTGNFSGPKTSRPHPARRRPSKVACFYCSLWDCWWFIHLTLAPTAYLRWYTKRLYPLRRGFLRFAVGCSSYKSQE